MREPFGKQQTGSSTMPQKKNPNRCEKVEGMARMAKGFVGMIADNVVTWEERAIEQSCVERVAWPDLFHVVAHSLRVMNGVLSGLVVYPENMLREVHESRGTYAASEAKEFLKDKLAPLGIGHEDAYRIVQLACFNVFTPSSGWLAIRESVVESYGEAALFLEEVSRMEPEEIVSIREFVPEAKLLVTDELDLSDDQVAHYNDYLGKVFANDDNLKEWRKLFEPSFLLQNESLLYEKILGE